jgi:hypothetical protein
MLKLRERNLLAVLEPAQFMDVGRCSDPFFLAAALYGGRKCSRLVPAIRAIAGYGDDAEATITLALDRTKRDGWLA